MSPYGSNAARRAARAAKKPASAEPAKPIICVTIDVPAAADGTRDNAAFEAVVERLFAEKIYVLCGMTNPDNSRTIVTTRKNFGLAQPDDEDATK
jgi:hypothetical protein